MLLKPLTVSTCDLVILLSCLRPSWPPYTPLNHFRSPLPQASKPLSHSFHTSWPRISMPHCAINSETARLGGGNLRTFRSDREGNGNPLQCSCLENPRDGGAWWAAVYGVAQSRTQLKRLSSSSSKCILEVNYFTCFFLQCGY